MVTRPAKIIFPPAKIKNLQIVIYRQTYRTFLLYIDQDVVLGGMKAERASFLFLTVAYYVVFVFNDIQNSFKST